jgi:hypothetical protein
MSYKNIPIIVVLWEHDGYQGRRLVLTEDTKDLGDYGFHDMTSSIGIHPGPNYVPGTKYEISFYEHGSYGGAQLVLTGPGIYPSLRIPYNFDNVISSVKFKGVQEAGMIPRIPIVAELYEHANFTGRKFIVIQDIANLNTYGAFGGITSSVKVMEGPDFGVSSTIKLYSGINRTGNSIELNPGMYPNLYYINNFGDACQSVYISDLGLIIPPPSG